MGVHMAWAISGGRVSKRIIVDEEAVGCLVFGAIEWLEALREWGS